jgi:hypothetical protein
MDTAKVFQKYNKEFLRFERILEPRNQRPDLCAFLMLYDALPNSSQDMIVAAEHDEIWLDVQGEQLATLASNHDLIRDLVRCGVRYDDDNDQLAMYA